VLFFEKQGGSEACMGAISLNGALKMVMTKRM